MTSSPPEQSMLPGLNLSNFRERSIVQAMEAEQAAQTSAPSRGWFRSSRQSQPGILRRKGIIQSSEGNLSVLNYSTSLSQFEVPNLCNFRHEQEQAA